jgi:2-polyprenyl-6-hydroxyphenyl methylase/3-demethylubiquinone-9 3-methyltransferase
MSIGRWKWRLAQNLEIRWWKRYLTGKDKSAYYEWKRNYWLNALNELKEFVPKLSGLHIADVGSGPAGIFTILNDNTVDAIDPLIDSYKNSISIFITEDFPWVNFVNQDLENWTPEKKYDVIFCLNAINHVENIYQGYRNLYNALKPGGILVISTDAHRWNLLKWIFNLLPGDMLHPQQFNLEDYRLMLNREHFTIHGEVCLHKGVIFSHYVQVARKGLY